MHPILTRSRRLLLYLSIFVPVALLETELLRLVAGGDRFELWLAVQPALLVHAMSCLASFYLCRSLPLSSQSWPRGLAAHIATSAMSAALVLFLTEGWASQLEAYGFGVAEPVQRGAALVFLFAFLLAMVAGAAHYVYLAVLSSEDAERRAFELRLLAQEAELRALRAQLDPHFLFNSLNAIHALIGAEPVKARKMCGSLAEFLRQSLRQGTPTTIALREELTLIESYLAVEQIRFGERLRCRFEVEPDLETIPLPPLLLQPLVENAVRHGIAHRIEGGELAFSARREGPFLRLVLRNDRDADAPGAQGTGLGLANVRGRLAALYGGGASMRVSVGEHHYEVELKLPAEENTE